MPSAVFSSSTELPTALRAFMSFDPLLQRYMKHLKPSAFPGKIAVRTNVDEFYRPEKPIHRTGKDMERERCTFPSGSIDFFFTMTLSR